MWWDSEKTGRYGINNWVNYWLSELIAGAECVVKGVSVEGIKNDHGFNGISGILNCSKVSKHKRIR